MGRGSVDQVAGRDAASLSPDGRNLEYAFLDRGRHAPAYGNLFPALHISGGCRISAAAGLQSGWMLQTLRILRPSGAAYVYGVWL